jgi:hypothetical protein
MSFYLLPTLQKKICAYLKENGRQSVRNIAMGTGVDKGWLTHKLAELRVKGYIADELKRESYPNGSIIMVHWYWITKAGLDWLDAGTPKKERRY